MFYATAWEGDRTSVQQSVQAGGDGGVSRVVGWEDGLQRLEDFQVLGAVSQTIGAEEGAVRSAATEIARSIVSLTIDRF